MTDSTGDAALLGGNELCSSCGLCCNGSLFSYFRLRDDETGLAERLGLAVSQSSRTGGKVVALACAKHDGSCCTVHELRPHGCRAFECDLLIRLQRDEIGWGKAVRIASDARRQAEELRGLACKLFPDYPANLPLVRYIRSVCRDHGVRMHTTGFRDGEEAFIRLALSYVQTVERNFAPMRDAEMLMNLLAFARKQDQTRLMADVPILLPDTPPSDPVPVPVPDQAPRLAVVDTDVLNCDQGLLTPEG